MFDIVGFGEALALAPALGPCCLVFCALLRSQSAQQQSAEDYSFLDSNSCLYHSGTGVDCTLHVPLVAFQESIKRIVLLNLNHAGRFARLDLADPSRNFPCEREERLGVRRVLSFEHDRLATVTGFAHLGIEFDIA